jgi:hypothetical protein
MKITRIIALAAIAGISGAAGLQAQTLRPTSPPAEFPPASFKGKQYVDSRGCIYVRAGIDGNVTWVPRVTRSRKQICGYEPTPVVGATRQPPRAPAPELITLEPDQQIAKSPAQTSPKPPASSPPKVVTTSKPQRTARTTSVPTAQPVEAAAATAAAATARAKPVVRANPKPRVVPRAQPTIPAESGAGGCAGLSDISRQYSNAPGARCGPQGAAPVTYEQQSSVLLTPNTRVVQAHIYQTRRQSNSFEVPNGYRPVWDDGRLNPRRAERTLRPAMVTPFSGAPAGYEVVEREDGRMNPMRGQRTATGDAQMAEVWTDGLPRRLVQKPLDRPVVTLSRRASRSPAEAKAPALRLSTRSAPGAETPAQPKVSNRYVRAATYAEGSEAKAAARKLAASGLPVRLGRLSRGGQSFNVVLAGPFQDPQRAEAALARVREIGFTGAKLSR